jgi:hypothetical protein
MRHVALKTSEAAAMQRGAMETETIQKNGASPKSLMSRGNFLKFIAVFFAASFIFSGCSKDKDDANPLEGLWAFKEANYILYFDGESFNVKEEGGDLTSVNQSFRGWSIEFTGNNVIMGMGGQTSQPIAYSISGNIITLKEGPGSTSTVVWRYNV